MTWAETAELQRLERVVDNSPSLTETQKIAIRCLIDRIKEVWSQGVSS